MLCGPACQRTLLPQKNNSERLTKDADDLERDQHQECKHHNQPKNEQPALPIAAVLDDVPHTLCGGAQAAVCDIHVLLQVTQQSRVQIELLTNSHSDVLREGGRVRMLHVVRTVSGSTSLKLLIN
jgi:hypothetical protein